MLTRSTLSNESWPGNTTYHTTHIYIEYVCTISSFSPELGCTAPPTIHRMGRAHWAPPAWLFRHSWTRALSCHLRTPGFLIIQTQTSNNIFKISPNNEIPSIIYFKKVTSTLALQGVHCAQGTFMICMHWYYQLLWNRSATPGPVPYPATWEHLASW